MSHPYHQGHSHAPQSEPDGSGDHNQQQQHHDPQHERYRQQQQQQQQQHHHVSHDMRLNIPPPPIFYAVQPHGESSTDYPNPYGPPPPQIYYASEHEQLQQGQGQSQAHTMSVGSQVPPSMLYPPSVTYGSDPSRQHNQRPLSLPPSPFENTSNPHLTMAYMQQSQLSPYTTPLGGAPMLTASSTGSAGSANMNEYFPPFPTGVAGLPPQIPSQASQAVPPPFPSPAWQSAQPAIAPAPVSAPAAGPSTSGGRNSNGPKTSRQQFTACGACRHRRVKCDLKDRQEQAERLAAIEEDKGVGPVRGQKKKKVVCSNCQERGTNCVDEFAPIKAAKQLRRGKRISEIEMLYGRQAANAAAASTDPGAKMDKVVKEEGIPDLAPEFFDSAFFRRFQIQRPVLDPNDFVARYLANPTPTAAAMGPEGAIMCHVLYAWATSYGVDERGVLDVPEGGAVAGLPTSLLEPNQDELKRESDRQVRWAKMRPTVQFILDEIDACGIMRKPTWDGVRVLLLLLPLTEGISTPVERLAMYESALSQAYMLCSHGAMGYDGQAAGTSGASGGTDTPQGRELLLVRVRTYWYTFVHEGITTGLKGGRLHLDGDDMETMQDSISNRTLVLNSQSFRSASKLAVAPINLALACRLINRALTGPSAKRKTAINPDHVKEAWEALEACWEEFDSLRGSSPVAPYQSQDEVNHFVDGWKIFLFEAQNVIKDNLEDRLTKLTEKQSSAFISDPCLSESNANSDAAVNNSIVTVGHLLEIAKGKCDVKTRQIVDIVRRHVGGQMFEWDASLVRDGTYYAAMILAKRGGSDEDIALCIQALNELRWAHAKAWERSADLRREWATSRSAHSNSSSELLVTGWDPASIPPSATIPHSAAYPQYSTQSVQSQQEVQLYSSYPTSAHSQGPSSSRSLPAGLHIQTQPRPQPPPQTQSYNSSSGPLSAHSNTRSQPQSRGAATDSSLSNSNSPYTSPGIISPTYDAAGVAHFPIPSAQSMIQPGFRSPAFPMFSHNSQMPSHPHGNRLGHNHVHGMPTASSSTSTPGITPPPRHPMMQSSGMAKMDVGMPPEMEMEMDLRMGLGMGLEMGLGMGMEMEMSMKMAQGVDGFDQLVDYGQDQTKGQMQADMDGEGPKPNVGDGGGETGSGEEGQGQYGFAVDGTGEGHPGGYMEYGEGMKFE